MIGYMAKRTEAPSPKLGLPPHVVEICSVSECISSGPSDWMKAWRHNELFLFNSPELAFGVVPEAERQAFDLYAYRALPKEFWEDRSEPWPLPELGVTPPDAGFQSLGWDLVSRSSGTSFECSPLSCNGLAAKIPVNAQCLLSTPEEALALAESAELQRAEPGPYVVAEVLRRSQVCP